LWKSTDALVISTVVTGALKYATTRVRPSKTDNPNQWFTGVENDSFPSGHVSSVTALVTPIILEYRNDTPWIFTLAAIPLYVWKSTDALVISTIITEALKYATTRVRPSKTDNPNQWFTGEENDSFPSGHVSSVTALVTPIILEYRNDTPWIFTLAAIPLYEAGGRVKVQAHWQTDVLAGMAVGIVAGYYEYRFDSPIIFYVLPEGIYAGLKYRF